MKRILLAALVVVSWLGYGLWPNSGPMFWVCGLAALAAYITLVLKW